jgi:hypothetical protein
VKPTRFAGRTVVCAVVVLAVPSGAAGEGRRGGRQGTATVEGSQVQAKPTPVADPDLVLDPAQPEFTVVNLPTTLGVPSGRWGFRVSHRFTRDLTAGSFGELLENFFGFDGGAQIGLELRYGLARGWQVGTYRTSDRTIQLFTQYKVVRQSASRPIGLDALAGVEGTNNLRRTDPRQPDGRAVRSPAIGVVVSRTAGRAASVNVTLAWVGNALARLDGGHDAAVVAGIGGRLRVRPTVYLVAEATPRLARDAPGTALAAFGIEKRVGGHAFQVHVSNGIGSTLAQVARGAPSAERWHIGFNINRKFY